MNRYRRKAPVRTVKGESRESARSKMKDNTTVTSNCPDIYIAVDTLAQLRTAAAYPAIARIYLNLSTITEAEEEEAFYLMQNWREKTMKEACCSDASGNEISGNEISDRKVPELYLNLPSVLRGHMKDRLSRRLEIYARSGAEGFLVHTWDQAAWLREALPQMKLQADTSLYTYNGQAAQTLAEAGISGTALPVELNVRELQERQQDKTLPAEMIGYGYLPVMVSAQCVHRTVSGCDARPGMLHLRDRKKKNFTVRNCCRYCFNVIYNSEPLFLLDCDKEWKPLGLQALRLQFTIENEREMRQILDGCLDDLTAGRQVENPLKNYTRGHFRRGVE